MAKNDLAVAETIELCPGLVIDTKLKMGAVWWLEDKFDKTIADIRFDSGRIRDMANLIIALALQHNPKLTEEKAEQLFKQLELEQLTGVIEKLTSVFDIQLKSQVKNLPRANRKRK